MTQDSLTTGARPFLASISRQELAKLSKTQLLSEFNREGICDLDALAERLVNCGLERLAPPAPDTAIDFAALAGGPCRETEERIVHRRPNVPFTVDGVLYEPDEINRFDGQSLHFVLKRKSDKDKMLIGFKDRGLFIGLLRSQWMAAQVGVSQGSVLPGVSLQGMCCNWEGFPGGLAWVCRPCGDQGKGGGGGATGGSTGGTKAIPFPASGEAIFYEHAGFTGEKLSVPGNPATAYSNLTKVNRSGILFWAESWNDAISSISLNKCIVQVFEHINYEGTSLLLESSKDESTTFGNPTHVNLVDLGWNDRISSVVNWGPVW
jgi:hypothetical protein